jgi:threonine dehydrogenase-like Zn-dependent dehydrogenase
MPGNRGVVYVGARKGRSAQHRLSQAGGPSREKGRTRRNPEGFKAQAMEKMQDLTCITDILPTGNHGCATAGVTAGSTVLVSGAGPVGSAAAASAFLLGAAVVIVSDFNQARLAQVKSFGFATIDLSQEGSIGERIEKILRCPKSTAQSIA